MKKQNGDTLLYVFFALLLVVIVMLGLYYAKASKTNKKTATGISSTTVPTIRIPTRNPEDLPIVKKDAVTKKEIIEIPFLYAIRSITDTEMIFGKDGGTAEEVISYYPKSQTIKVYKGVPPGEVAASLSDLKVGQKIKVKNIIGEAIYFYIAQ